MLCWNHGMFYRKRNNVRDGFKTQPPVDRRFRPVPPGFYCTKQWQPPGTGRNHRSTVGWVLKPPLNVYTTNINRELKMQRFYFLTFYMLLINIFHFSTDEHLNLIKGSKLFLPFENSLLFYVFLNFKIIIWNVG